MAQSVQGYLVVNEYFRLGSVYYEISIAVCLLVCLSVCPLLRKLKWNVESKLAFAKVLYLFIYDVKQESTQNMLNPNFPLLSLSYVNVMLCI